MLEYTEHLKITSRSKNTQIQLKISELEKRG